MGCRAGVSARATTVGDGAGGDRTATDVVAGWVVRCGVSSTNGAERATVGSRFGRRSDRRRRVAPRFEVHPARLAPAEVGGSRRPAARAALGRRPLDSEPPLPGDPPESSLELREIRDVLEHDGPVALDDAVRAGAGGRSSPGADREPEFSGVSSKPGQIVDRSPRSGWAPNVAPAAAACRQAGSIERDNGLSSPEVRRPDDRRVPTR